MANLSPDKSNASLIDAMQERLTASALEFYKKHPNNAPQHVVIAMCDELLIYRGEPKKCGPPASIPSSTAFVPVDAYKAGYFDGYNDAAADDAGNPESASSVDVQLAQEKAEKYAATKPVSAIERRPDGRPFGAALATFVLQSPEYRLLDDLARSECDELIERWKAWLKS